MTPEEYQRICGRLARKALRFAEEMASNEEIIATRVACPKCERPTGEPCKFPVWSPDSDPAALIGRATTIAGGFVHNERAVAARAAEREHWIDVFMDVRLPDIDDDVLLEVTRHAKAYEESTGTPAPSREIAAVHAFQADVWEAINQTEAA